MKKTSIWFMLCLTIIATFTNCTKTGTGNFTTTSFITDSVTVTIESPQDAYLTVTGEVTVTVQDISGNDTIYSIKKVKPTGFETSSIIFRSKIHTNTTTDNVMIQYCSPTTNIIWTRVYSSLELSKLIKL
jgi:hypothetical protein